MVNTTTSSRGGLTGREDGPQYAAMAGQQSSSQRTGTPTAGGQYGNYDNMHRDDAAKGALGMEMYHNTSASQREIVATRVVANNSVYDVQPVTKTPSWVPEWEVGCVLVEEDFLNKFVNRDTLTRR